MYSIVKAKTKGKLYNKDTATQKENFTIKEQTNKMNTF